MSWTSGVTVLSAEPAESMLQQHHGLFPGWGACGLSRLIGGDQLNQSRGDLFSGSPRPLTLEGMPLPVTDRQTLLQRFGQVAGVLRPALTTGDQAFLGLWGGIGGLHGELHGGKGLAVVHPGGPGPSWERLVS